MLCNKSVWARSLAGKAPRSQRGDRGFESPRFRYNKAIPFGMVLLYLNRGDSNQPSLRSLLRMASPCFAVRFRTAAKAARKRPQGHERKRGKNGIKDPFFHMSPAHHMPNHVFISAFETSSYISFCKALLSFGPSAL